MKNFPKDRVGDVEVFVGEPNDQVREGLRSMLRECGFRRARTFARMTDLVNAIKEEAPALLIISDDLDPTMFDVVRDIRNYRIGRNPFLMIGLLVRGDVEGAVRKALLSGADDVMIKPVAPGKMMDRLAHITSNRVPFIVTNDYLGPERRRADDTRPSQIKQLNVVNTLKAAVDGQRITGADLARAVEGCMKEVMSARLDSHGMKLGWVCAHILKAYEEKRIDTQLAERILILVAVLEDAGRTAQSLGEKDLAAICTQMARQVEEMAENYENPTSLQLGTVQKLTKAFELAKSAKAAPKPAAAQ